MPPSEEMKEIRRWQRAWAERVNEVLEEIERDARSQRALIDVGRDNELPATIRDLGAQINELEKLWKGRHSHDASLLEPSRRER